MPACAHDANDSPGSRHAWNSTQASRARSAAPRGSSSVRSRATMRSHRNAAACSDRSGRGSANASAPSASSHSACCQACHGSTRAACHVRHPCCRIASSCRATSARASRLLGVTTVTPAASAADRSKEDIAVLRRAAAQWRRCAGRGGNSSRFANGFRRAARPRGTRKRRRRPCGRRRGERSAAPGRCRVVMQPPRGGAGVAVPWLRNGDLVAASRRRDRSQRRRGSERRTGAGSRRHAASGASRTALRH